MADKRQPPQQLPQQPPLSMPGKDSMAKYIVPAQDRQGHSAGVHFRLPPGMLRDINNLMMHKDNFGWENHSDFYRWAVRNGLDECCAAVRDKTLSNMGLQRKAIHEVLATVEMHARFGADIDKVAKVVEDLDQNGDREQAVRMLLEVQKHVHNMDDGYWRTKWQREIKRRFDKYLKPTSLTDFDEE